MFIHLYKKLRRKYIGITATSHTLNEKFSGNGRINGSHKTLYEKWLISDIASG